MTPLQAYHKANFDYWRRNNPDRKAALRRLHRAWRRAGGKHLHEIDPKVAWGCFRLHQATVDTREHLTWEDPLKTGGTWGSEPWSSYVVLPTPAAFR